MLKVNLVIPTIRDLLLLKKWKSEFSKCHLIVVEDSDVKTVKTSGLKFASVTHLSHQDIEKDFGNNSWIISRKNAVC
jgi:hypothetical protein